jgi:biopolymer transport protein ExbB
MFEILSAGGWIMIPILLCSIIATAIIIERFWTLQKEYIIPADLVPKIWKWIKEDDLDKGQLIFLHNHSPMGEILAAALTNRNHSREIMKASIEEASNQVLHKLEKYLNTLGTIAEIAPLLGLLGTVTGMIAMFAAVGEVGLGNPKILSGGLSEALITTATGLSVAIPAFIFYRYFRGVVDELILTMEQEALKIIDVLHGDREQEL